jgi:glycosyltransferase involved in cell wall biosynthesis
MPPRVLFLTNMYPTPSEPWFGCFVAELAEQLKQFGLHVSVLAFDGRANKLEYGRAAWRLRAALRRESFDLVHAHYGLCGLIALTQRRVPVVTTFHGPEYTGQTPGHWRACWRVAARSCAIFVSRDGQQRFGLPHAPVIPAGVDTRRFTPLDRREARRALGWSQECRYALLPGARSVRSKRSDLFEAAIEVAAQTVPGLRSVSLEGYSRREAALVFNAVDVTVMTSDYEGAPVSIKESLACGTPVVSVAVGDVPRTIAGLPGCAIVPRRPEDIAQGVLGALDAGRPAALRQRAERFSNERMAARTHAVYESVLRKAKATTKRPRHTKAVCAILHGPYPLGSSRALSQVAAARASGFEVDVVATRRPGEPLHEFVDGARVYRLPLIHRRGRSLAGTLFEYLAFAVTASARVAALAIRTPYAAVVIRSPPDFLVIAGLVPKLLGARLVLDIQDLSTDMFEMRFGDRLGAPTVNRLLRVLGRCAAAPADAVVTVHEPYRRELVCHGVAPRKIVIVMNTLDERLLPPRREYGGKRGFRVVYHGTISPHYGVLLLIEAAGRLTHEIPSLLLEIYGEGDALPAARRRAQQLGLDDAVFFSGCHVPQREVLKRVSGASVGVVPNLPIALNRFALSTKLFEYVALGVPVVAADLPTIRVHFSADEISFFRPGDADALAAALLRIFRDPTAATSRAAAAQRRYENYRWDLQAKSFAAALSAPADCGRHDRWNR